MDRQITTMRTSEEIRIERETFESQFHPEIIRAGTPNRKKLQQEADERGRVGACAPENIKRRATLIAEYRKAVRSEKLRKTLARKAADPVEQDKRWVAKWLRKLGLKREVTTDSRSAYYSLGKTRVRVADHDVPITSERQYNADNGGFTWAVHGWNLNLVDSSRMDLARKLVYIRQEVRRVEMSL